MGIVYRERIHLVHPHYQEHHIKICITGAAGFIGLHLVRGCLAAGHQVVAFDRVACQNPAAWQGLAVEWVRGDVTDPAAIDAAIMGCEAVFHHAAEVSVHDSIHHPLNTFYTNVHGTAVVLDAARRHGIQWVTFPSSAAVYGNSDRAAQSESDAVGPLSPYGASKWMGESLCNTYQQQYGLNCLVLRYFNVLGKGQSPDSPYAAVIPAWIKRLKQGLPLVIYGDGLQTRDFVSVDVIVAAHLQAVGRQAPPYPLNVGSGQPVTLLTLAQTLQQVAGYHAGIEYHPPRTNEVRHSCANTTQMAAFFKGLPIPSLAQTLQGMLTPRANKEADA